MNKFDLVENRIKSLIQKSTVFFPWADKNVELMSLLIENVQSNVLENSTTGEKFPQTYTVKMNSKNAKIWQAKQSWAQDLRNAYDAILKEYGIKQDYSPVFTLVIKNSLADDEVVIEGNESNSPKDRTSSVRVLKANKDLSQQNYPILLFGDNKEIRISSSVISIGRRNTNDIVIDDMRISRLHAQIRMVPDGYMIFDTGSTGGTFVNSARISQQLLKTGDVISLGGYRFIFLQENLKDPTTPYQRDTNSRGN
jgi:hypothetical protein